MKLTRPVLPLVLLCCVAGSQAPPASAQPSQPKAQELPHSYEFTAVGASAAAHLDVSKRTWGLRLVTGSLKIGDQKYSVRGHFIGKERLHGQLTAQGAPRGRAGGAVGALTSPGGAHSSRGAKRWRATIQLQGLRATMSLKDPSGTVAFLGETRLLYRDLGNEQLVREFFTALVRKDADEMLKAYASNARFSDVVFPDLSPADSRSMWGMIVASDSLSVSFGGIRADGEFGTAYWTAVYDIAGKTVRNEIYSSFRFSKGKIVQHEDWYDFGKWADQGIASSGALKHVPKPVLIWLVRKQAARTLADFVKTSAR